MEDGDYLDPMLAGNGRDGIDAMTAAFIKAYPDHRFTLLGDVEQHHNRLRFRWQLVTPEGDIALLGTDFGVVTDDNQLRSITGFLDNP